MTRNAQSSASTQTQGPHKIWITANYYLHVDYEGFIMGTCYEGALGCVVPLLSARDPNRLALKIPRMLADTVRENAYISQVVSAESVIVYRANEEYKATAGLIPVQALGRDILRGIRELRNGFDLDARRQDGCILLFSFRKDRNPRICAVKYDAGQRVAFPPGCDHDLSFLSHDLWERAQAAACNVVDPDASSYYFEVSRQRNAKQASSDIVHAPLITTMDTEEWPEVWFGALPSILYNWASGTLQEAVSQGRLHEWSLDQHYELCCRVLRGVDTLHSKKFIHGDLRPANIMTCGGTNAPEDYVVADYGSFSGDSSQFGTPQAGNTGHTTMMVGGLGRHRTSLFYAPERRAGVERETADVALILSSLDDIDVHGEYFIYFGWRSRMLDPRTNAPDERLLRQLRQDWRRMIEARPEADRQPPIGDRLARGDRLRVREFIFTVLDAEEFEDVEDQQSTESGAQSHGKRLVFRCSRRFAQVLHERLTVYHSGEDLADCTVIGLPNYVELRQWSVATDLYGTGALILYTVFMSGLHRGLPAAAELPPRTQATDDAMSNSETLLAQMLEMLEGIPSFLALWSDLEDFRWNIEHPDHATLSGSDLARVEIRHRPSTYVYPDAGAGSGSSTMFSSEDPNERRTLGGFALRTVNNLLRSVPNIRYVLHVFQFAEAGRAHPPRAGSSYNAAHFLLFVHFVMACLHRRSHLRDTGELDLSYPFCRDRCYAAGPGGPADRALVRLEELKRRLLQPRYDSIVVQDKQLVNFDPRDVMQIRIEHAQLGRELAIRSKELDELRPQMAAAVTALAERDVRCEGASARAGQLKKAMEDLQLQLRTLERERETAKAALLAAQGDVSTLREEVKVGRDEARRAANELRQRDQLVEAARHQCAVLQETRDGQEAENVGISAKLAEQARVIKEFNERFARINSERQTLMNTVEESMAQCLEDVAEIKSTAWRVPQDKLDRLTRTLELWRAWRAHSTASRAQPGVKAVAANPGSL